MQIVRQVCYENLDKLGSKSLYFKGTNNCVTLLVLYSVEARKPVESN